MGKIIFDALQQLAVNAFIKNPYLCDHFYFTGGTALSVFHFQHRLSDDLDFFSEESFSPNELLTFINNFSKKHNCQATLRRPDEHIYIYDLDFKTKGRLKVDFNYYPYKRIEQSKIINNLSVDSLRDIGTNKLMTINQRIQVKDFVDLYFLFQHFTLWDLLYGVENKFHVKLDLVMVASDFMKVEEFDFLPKMLVPLTLEELTVFFRKKAKEIGERIKK